MKGQTTNDHQRQPARGPGRVRRRSRHRPAEPLHQGC
nr:MAG TPA: hypothetical protein [Caudoviricetes sp.]